MAKKNAREPAAPPVATAPPLATTTTAVPPPAPAQPKPAAGIAALKSTGSANWDQVLGNIYTYYTKETPQRTKLIDVFLAFLAAVGALQFVYCVLAGNYVRLQFACVSKSMLKRGYSLSMPSSPASVPPLANSSSRVCTWSFVVS